MTAGQLAVVGLGTMGTGIAITGLLAGQRVVGCEVDQASLDGGLARVRAYLDGSVRRGKLTEAERVELFGHLVGTTELARLTECDVVIEAVPEEIDLKAALLARLDEVCDTETLIATNTSTLPVTRIASASRWPERVVGTHFCNPAPLMPLVEVVQGIRTSDRALQRAYQLVADLDKVSVTTADTPGFLVNRFLVPFENDCIRALEAAHGTAATIDVAVTKGLGYPMGPFRLLDIVGLDVHHAVSMSLYEQLRDPRFAPPPLVDRMIAAGHLGRKTGQGFYSYGQPEPFGA